MCGIVGILGKNEVAPILVEALKRLEYRGYDSAGIATVNGGALARRRAVGKLVNLSDLLVHEPLAGKAELARIGRYYATESMLVLNPATGRYDADATPEYGSDTLQDFYRRAIADPSLVDRGDHAVF